MSCKEQLIEHLVRTASTAIVLVTLAANEYHMPANLAHYEALAELEDDVISFLPTVTDIEVFGCEVELLQWDDTKLPLRDPIHSALLTQTKSPANDRPAMHGRRPFHLAVPRH